MTELKLGNKYECFNCGAKFYDMGKGEPLCPKCGADQKDAEEENPLVTQSVKRTRKAELLPEVEEAVEVAEDDAVEVPVGEDLDDEDLDDEDLDLELDEDELDDASDADDDDADDDDDD